MKTEVTFVENEKSIIDEVFRMPENFDIDLYFSSEVYFPLSNIEEILEKINEKPEQLLKEKKIE